MPSPRHCFRKKSQFNFDQWWALGRVTQVDFVLLNRASLEKGGSSRRYKNPGNKGGRGLTYAKIITNKRSCGASAIIGSLCHLPTQFWEAVSKKHAKISSRILKQVPLNNVALLLCPNQTLVAVDSIFKKVHAFSE